jgi:hypothetical protein
MAGMAVAIKAQAGRCSWRRAPPGGLQPAPVAQRHVPAAAVHLAAVPGAPPGAGGRCGPAAGGGARPGVRLLPRRCGRPRAAIAAGLRGCSGGAMNRARRCRRDAAVDPRLGVQPLLLCRQRALGVLRWGPAPQPSCLARIGRMPARTKARPTGPSSSLAAAWCPMSCCGAAPAAPAAPLIRLTLDIVDVMAQQRC